MASSGRKMKSAAVLLAVPNFSEGRRAKVVKEVVAAASNPLVRILDVHSDPDHNRSVLTAAGPPVALIDAMVAGTRAALRLIDLTSHKGEHPRLGAMDVIPFVPVLDATLPEAEEAAEKCGARIAEELAIPCFFYENNARSQKRASLPALRKAAFAGMPPDVGPSRPHPTAGATVVGARGPLVAFNVNLASGDLRAAERVVRSIRTTSGGLPHVRAMAVLLSSRGIVQVSMNLTRPSETTIADAYDACAQAATDAGVRVLESEIVGVTPRAALGGRALESLSLREPVKVLEDELARAFPGAPAP